MPSPRASFHSITSSARLSSVAGTSRLARKDSRNGRLWNIGRGRSLRFDVGIPDHLGPLLGFVGDELAEIGRRTLKDRYAQGGKSRLDLGISEGGIDFLVELVDDFGWRGPRCADAVPGSGFIARHEFTHGGDVRQRLRADRGRYAQGAHFA